MSSSRTPCERTYGNNIFIPKWYFGDMGPKEAKLFKNSEKYLKLLSSTESFYAGDWKLGDLEPIFGGVYRWPATCSDARGAAAFAVSHYNQLHGTDLEFKKLIRVNAQSAKAVEFFLTLETSDGAFYEAKVYHMSKDDRKFRMMRPALHYPEISPNLRHLIGPSDDFDESSSSICPKLDLDGH